LSNSRFSNNSLCGRGSRHGFLVFAKKSELKLVSHAAVTLRLRQSTTANLEQSAAGHCGQCGKAGLDESASRELSNGT
jgi:hypothetical protein